MFHIRKGHMMSLGQDSDFIGGTPGYRMVEIFDRLQKAWRFIPMKELEMGSKYRVYEIDRTPVVDFEGYKIFEALSSPEPSPEGQWIVNYKGLEK